MWPRALGRHRRWCMSSRRREALDPDRCHGEMVGPRSVVRLRKLGTDQLATASIGGSRGAVHDVSGPGLATRGNSAKRIDWHVGAIRKTQLNRASGGSPDASPDGQDVDVSSDERGGRSTLAG